MSTRCWVQPTRGSLGVFLSPMLLGMLVFASAADAQTPERANERTDPELTRRAEGIRGDVATEVRSEPAGKAGPLMANLKAGPSIGLGGLDATATVQLDVGYALVKGRAGDLYGVVAPEVQVGSGVVLTLPVGVQYDIPVPIRNVYVYPRVVAGYSALLDPSDDGDSGDAFTVIPTAGVKFVPTEGFNLGFEPFGMPIHLGNGDVEVQYRMLAYGGGNF